MGCTSSKQKGCIHCSPSHYPMPRSYSMHVHHPPQSKGDTYHVVALTSTTLGSLDLVSHNHHGNGCKFSNGKVSDSESFITQKEEEKSEAKTWSNMIEEKLPKKVTPKTPITTPPCEPETINTWELMEGLEDTGPLLRSPVHFRSFSFDVVRTNGHVDPAQLKASFIEEGSNLKDEVSDFDDDPQVVSSFQKSLQEKKESMAKTRFFPFEEKKINSGDKVVLYFTSLRGVRKTYEDCCNVRLILKGLGFKVDERDVSMHLGFKEELRELLIDGFGGLPRVFVGRKYIGGAEEIQKLHEDGKLEKLLDCCERIDDHNDVCDGCGDIRFVPCETCSGSCKIYYDDDEEEEEQDHGEVGEYGFQRCPDCNENGLIRCPMCYC
ncbi:uncharacterized protein At3g28850-like [Lotus japonicus]|uniref:uncharacterized protein At3g28850-like n=1 Tax=Lotus japonicus TaxID=34305 RepID=UPI002590D965|nr:uncharacterized protein At3g28850-like [Lotus japonicus]